MCISVIISNFNGARFLPRLMESLQSQVSVETEIIVVDRNSTDGSDTILKLYPNIIVIQEPPDSGLVSGYSAGAKISSHEHLFFCNEDMWFAHDCLSILETHINLEKQICAADPWQWTYDSSEWIHGGVRIKKDFNIRSLGNVYPCYRFDFTVSLQSGEKTAIPCAGAFLIHRDIFFELGGWDTSFFLDHEDTDLFIRAWQRGWSCVTVPSAKVFHAVGASNTHSIKKNNTKQSVSRRRYISSRANAMAIALKYFPLYMIPITLLTGIAIFLSNILKLRFSMVIWNILAWIELIGRLPNIFTFRSINADWNKKNPGHNFFRDPSFQVRKR